MAAVYKVKVKWGGETYDNVEANTSESTETFKAQLFALTHVPPERQKVVIAGKRLGDSWAGVKLKNGMMVMLMGTADDIPAEPVQATKFLEDMTPEELGQVVEGTIPAGLTNMGNTCYMNSVLQVWGRMREDSSLFVALIFIFLSFLYISISDEISSNSKTISLQ